MLYVHPLIQLAAMALGLYALVLAWPRILSLHLGRSQAFRRPRHILAGELALGIMLAGMAGGLLMVRLFWGQWLLTGVHGKVGLTMLPLLVFGLVSGLYMASSPKPRKALPLAHGLNNLLVLALALAQFMSGRQILAALAPGS
jgi:hypothetical protein